MDISERIYGLNSVDDDIMKMCERVIDEGACFVGFSDITDISGNKGYKSCVTIAYKLFDGIIEGIKDAPTYEYFHHYRTVNATLDRIALWTATYLNRSGDRSCMIAASQSSVDNPYAGAFPHKTGAVLCGAGFIGKNALFISDRFGSSLRLVSVLTDRQFDFSRKLSNGSCFGCDKCVKACPAGAITGHDVVCGAPTSDIVDVEKCSRHMKSKYQHIGRGSVCGICIAVCPHNRNTEK